jgi:LPXTG-site transpeptidase (sortase) family protein
LSFLFIFAHFCHYPMVTLKKITKRRGLARLTSVLVGGLGLYLVSAPFLPQLQYWLAGPEATSLSTIVSEPMKAVITPRVSMAAAISAGPGFEEFITDNLVVIPSIGVHSVIYEGDSIKTMDQGIWRRPKTSTPDKGGNTVLVGHRFLYTSGPRTFYHLDKVTVGEMITLFWRGKRYVYQVDSSVVAGVSALEVEQPTAQPVLTLYTCTPLLTADKRLVVRAHLVE